LRDHCQDKPGGTGLAKPVAPVLGSVIYSVAQAHFQKLRNLVTETPELVETPDIFSRESGPNLQSIRSFLIKLF
jgi:hypothetical protein